YAGDKLRSAAPTVFAALAKIPGVRVVSLMKEAAPDECAAAAAADIGATAWSDFAEAAAAFVNVDLVVSVDTAAAHLAGALGLAVLQENRPEGAVAYLVDAVRLKPDSAPLRLNCAVALAQLRRLPEAIGHFRKAIELHPASALGHANLGLAYVQSARYAEAAEVLETAARLDPRSADVHNHLGIAPAQLGREDEAARSYARAIELRPDYHATHTNLG